MRTGTAIFIIFIILAVCFISERHYREVEAHEEEITKGYEGCIDYPPCGNDDSCVKAQIEGRQACARFWFGGNF